MSYPSSDNQLDLNDDLPTEKKRLIAIPADENTGIYAQSNFNLMENISKMLFFCHKCKHKYQFPYRESIGSSFSTVIYLRRR